jgi:hypothetical protein
MIIKFGNLAKEISKHELFSILDEFGFPYIIKNNIISVVIFNKLIELEYVCQK